MKVILDKNLFALLKSLIVKHKAFFDIFLENLRGPNAKLGGTFGADSVAYRNNGIKIVVFKLAANRSPAFVLNYREILGSCCFSQFIFCVNILKMQTDVVC